MSMQIEPQFNLVTLYSENNNRILVPDIALRGLTVNRSDFERTVEEDEERNSDPEWHIGTDSPDDGGPSLLEEFYRGRYCSLIVGARVSFTVPGTSTVAYLDSTMSSLTSRDDDYIDYLFEQECQELTAKLEELGIVVVSADPDVHPPVPTEGLKLLCAGG